MKNPVVAVLSLARRYERELVCGRCAGVIAWIRLRPFSLIRITDREGSSVNPLGGVVATRIAETRLADARAHQGSGSLLDAFDDPEAQIARYRRDLEYLHLSAGEVIYELTCTTCGARYLRSLPHLAAGVRRSPTGRVALT